jgi:hypothetical protein
MSQAPNLDDLDVARGGPFRYRWQGEIIEGPDPAIMSFELVMTCLALEFFPGIPNMPLFKREALARRWAAHYDLGTISGAQRLAYLVQRYRDDLAYDLLVHAGVDLGEAWRSRRWRTLLATIDRLPSHTYFAEAVSKDEEHAKMLAEHLAAAGEADQGSGPTAPPLRTWTPELRMLTNIFDAIRRVEWTTIAAQTGPKKAGPPPEASPTPHSLLDRESKRAERRRRLAAHQSLVARVLPHKRAESGEPPG